MVAYEFIQIACGIIYLCEDEHSIFSWPTGVMGEAKTWGGWPAAVNRGAAHIQWGQSLHCRVPVPEQLATPDQIHKQERRGDLRMSDFHTPTESYTAASAHQRWAAKCSGNTAICSLVIVHCV